MLTKQVACAMLALLVLASAAWAQLTGPRAAGSRGTTVATLEEQLINQLRATTEERQQYIRLIAAKVEQGQLDRGRVLALQRYAIRKNAHFPFPYFERVMRFEAERSGVYLPPVRLLAGTGRERLLD